MLEIKETIITNSPFDCYVVVAIGSDVTTTFHLIFLRDNCICQECQHPETKQRIADIFNDTEVGILANFEKAERASQRVFDQTKIDVVTDSLVCTWPNGHVSSFTGEWLLTHSYEPKLSSSKELLPPKKSWDATEFMKICNDNPEHKYNQISTTAPRLLQDIYVNGFGFIEDVPVSLEATQEVSEVISIIRPTHYDLGVWDFTSDLAKNDTAYTSLAIDMHTDGNYWINPPGLQLFHLLEHTNGEGGETRIVDVRKVVEVLLRLSSSDASWKTTFEILTTQPIAFHQAGEEGACFTQDHFPILSVDESKELVQCRWNNSDRSPQFPHPPKFPVNRIYEALFRFNSLINDPKYFVQFQLTPGNVLIFDNWRVLHARKAFTGHRRLCGSYLTRDDFLARLRGFNNSKDTILNSL